jgi:hypothetical protein
MTNCLALAPNKSLQRSENHEVLGRGRSGPSAPERYAPAC